MSLLSEIKKIKFSEFAVYSGLVVAIICPGILVVYLFSPKIFLSLGAIKLLLLSISITLPVFLLNTSIVGKMMATSQDAKEFDEVLILLRAIANTMLAFYTALYFSYLLSLSFLTFLILMALIVILQLIIDFIELTNKPRQSKKKTAKKRKAAKRKTKKRA